MKVKGKYIMTRVEGKTIALGTSHSLEVTLNVIDGRTKDDKGAHDVPGHISWRCGCEHLVGTNNNDTQLTYADLMALLTAKKPVDIELMIASNSAFALSAAGWLPGVQRANGYAIYGGSALITAVTQGAQVSGFASFSVQFSGQGELLPREYPLESYVEGDTLYLSGPADVQNNTLVIDSDKAKVINNQLSL